VRQLQPLVRRGQVLRQDRDLVGAEAGCEVAGADARLDFGGQLGEQAVGGGEAEAQVDAVEVKDERGNLLPTAIPKVTIVKHARYLPEDGSGDPAAEVDILARIEKNLREAPLSGFVAEGSAPFGSMSNSVDAALKRATLSGMPIVRVGRGNAEGPMDPKRNPLSIAGSNLTATKARLLLMACLMNFGSLPAASDPEKPTPAELQAVESKLAEYQAVFDTH
jgi:hypothetical protein